MWQRQEVNKCCWKNGAHRLAGCRVATNLKFEKNTISAKCNKPKYNKMRCAWIPADKASWDLFSLHLGRTIHLDINAPRFHWNSFLLFTRLKGWFRWYVSCRLYFITIRGWLAALLASSNLFTGRQHPTAKTFGFKGELKPPRKNCSCSNSGSLFRAPDLGTRTH